VARTAEGGSVAEDRLGGIAAFPGRPAAICCRRLTRGLEVWTALTAAEDWPLRDGIEASLVAWSLVRRWSWCRCPATDRWCGRCVCL